MATHDLVKLFDQTKVRVVWDDEKEKWFFSVMDIVQVLTDQSERRAAAKYWSVVKTRLKADGVELPTICSQLKMMAADGKHYNTDVADLEGILRIIQSIPSKKAEPVKRWLAQVGSERFYQMQDPEGIVEAAHVAKDGAEVARNARADIEHRLGHSVISSDKAIDHIKPQDELPFDKEDK